MPTTNTIEKTDVLLKVSYTVSPEEYAPTKEKIFREIAKGITLPGFRPGKAPESKLKEHIGIGALMEETARRAIEDAYPELIKKEGVRPVGAPRIAITKCVEGNPLEFTIEVPLYPPITLPDYKNIAAKAFNKKEEELVVTDKEIETALFEIKNHHEGRALPTEGDSPKTESVLDDAFAQSLGNFKNLADLQEKMKENLLFEKKQKQNIERRKKALTEIITAANIPLPPPLIDAETENMIAELKENTAQYGLAFDDYLRHSKKTEEDLRKELRATAEHRIREEFIIHEIAEKESLHPDAAEVEANVQSFLAARPDAKADDARRYVSELLLHEKVYRFLEQKEEITKHDNKK